MTDIEHAVITILAEQAMQDPAAITGDMTIEELGLDSLGLVEAIFAIEERFDISIPFNSAEPGALGIDLTSVASIVDAVKGLMAQEAA
jgi:acyl carrier protein